MKLIVCFVLLLSVAFAAQVDVKEIMQKLPPINIETEAIFKSVADFACEPGNCLPMLPDMCPFQFLCQLYCKEQKLNGACGGGSCKCF